MEHTMTEEEILKRAFAMPLTNPALPPGPYRFVNREYLIMFTAAQQYVSNGGQTGQPAGDVRTAAFDPTAHNRIRCRAIERTVRFGPYSTSRQA
jgi:hypothetical protein